MRKEKGTANSEDFWRLAEKLLVVKSSWTRRRKSLKDGGTITCNCWTDLQQEALSLLQLHLLQVSLQPHWVEFLEPKHRGDVWWPLQGVASNALGSEHNNYYFEYYMLYDSKSVPERIHERGRHDEALKQVARNTWLPGPEPAQRLDIDPFNPQSGRNKNLWLSDPAPERLLNIHRWRIHMQYDHWEMPVAFHYGGYKFKYSDSLLVDSILYMQFVLNRIHYQ